MDAMGPIPYCAQNSLLDAAFPKGALNYWKSQFLTDLSDDCIATLVECVASVPVADEPDRARALPRRGEPRARDATPRARCASPASTSSSSRSGPIRADTDARHRSGAATPTRRSQPYLGTARYVNYLDDDEADDPAARRLRPELRAAARAQGEVRSRRTCSTRT